MHGIIPPVTMIIDFKIAHTGLVSTICRNNDPTIIATQMIGLKRVAVSAGSSIATALRGGASQGVVLQDFSGEVAKYFSSLRTPASLILGASLGALFVAELTGKLRERSKLGRFCTRLYNTCIFTSFLLSMCCTVIATAAGVTLLHHTGLDKAVSAYDVLMRDFEFEFIAVRLSYLVSLLSFLLGITTRILLEYKLLDEERREEACVVVFSIGAVVSQLWSYINSTLYSSQSLFGMTFSLLQIILRRAFHEHRPLQVLSLACAAVATTFFARIMIYKKKRTSNDAIL